MELSFLQQTQAFFLSMLLGVFLAAGYGVVKFVRYAFSLGKTATVALDILFMLCWAFSVFFFSLAYLKGYIRVYVFFGSGLGFAAYRCSVGKVFYKIYSPVICCFRVIFHKICKKCKLFAKKLLKIACKILYNVSSKIEQIKKNHLEYRNRKKYERHKIEHQGASQAARRKPKQYRSRRQRSKGA